MWWCVSEVVVEGLLFAESFLSVQKVIKNELKIKFCQRMFVDSKKVYIFVLVKQKR